MPDFLLTDPGGQRFKLTVPDGVAHEDIVQELDTHGAQEAAEVAAQRGRRAVKPEGRRQEGMLTRGGEAIATSPVRLAEGAVNTAHTLFDEQMRTIPGQMEQDPQQFLRALGTVGGLGSPQFAMASRGALEGAGALAPAIRGAEGEPEKIVAAATKFRGKVYTGNVHVQSAEAAASAHGMDVSQFIDTVNREAGKTEATRDLDGFVTSTGRFVTREEAQEIANQQGQLHGLATRENKPRLSMEDMAVNERPGFGQPSQKGTTFGAFGGGARRGFASPRQIRSHLDELNEAVRSGRMTPEQLAQARTRMGLPAESSVNRLSATSIGTRPVSRQTLDELRQAELPEYARQRPAPPAAAVDRFSIRPPAAPQSSDPLGHYGQEFYNEHIAPHFPDQKAFVKSYFNGAYNGRFEVETTPEGHLSMEGPLVLDGNKFGKVTRRIDPDGQTAYHDSLRVDDKARGGGFVKQMTANQIDLYLKMGIERVELYANIDVGGYAWAKYGWLPDPARWPTTAWGLGTRLRLLASNLDKDTLAVVQAHLNDPDPRAIWDLSDIKTPWQHRDWDPKINTVGKAMLSGNNWEGTLLLNNEQQMARFNDYVSQGK
jgi:hypothetical protein